MLLVIGQDLLLIGARLLGLVHGAQSPDQARRAKAALDALHEAVSALRRQTPVPLDESLADWRAELSERLEPLAVQLEWWQPEQLDGRYPPVGPSACQLCQYSARSGFQLSQTWSGSPDPNPDRYRRCCLDDVHQQ